jgi:hypothetical protein
MEPELPLAGLFLHLVHQEGFPLTVRDYEDALRALLLGHGLGSRERLLRLLEALWARTEGEARRLSLAFQRLPLPSREEVAAWSGTELLAAGDETAEEMAGGAAAGRLEVADPAPRMQFGAPGQSGIGLPQAQVEPSRREPFILSPRTPVSQRSLVVAWRRLRIASRSGPRVDLDLEATIRERCRRGVLAEPVLVPARRNLARLIVLVDASPSMAAWRRMNAALEESLREGRLDVASLYYFHNVPGDRLFERDTLVRPASLAALLDRQGGSALLILGDGGAARGRRDRERIDGTVKFLAKVAAVWHPVAWVNPLPRRRWAGTSAEAIACLPGIFMSELTDDGLIEAVDVLRGKQTA